MERFRDNGYVLKNVIKLFIIMLTLDFLTVTVLCQNMDYLFSISANSEAASTTPAHFEDYYYYEQYDTNEILKIDSDYCRDRSTCSDTFYLTFPDKLCHCDKVCGLLNDCCRNHNSTPPLALTKEQFECVSISEIVKNMDYGVTVVTKCSPDWEHTVTRSLCEDPPDAEDILGRIPVNDKSEFGIMYRNMYCAQCNYVEDFLYWNPELLCRNETGVRTLSNSQECNLYFIRPTSEVTYRACQKSSSIISSCPLSENNTEELVLNCTDGVYSIVYDESGTMFRNKYCAVCNGIHGNIYCENIYPFSGPNPTDTPRSSYSFRLLVDFNTGRTSYNDEEKSMKKCKDNEIYDSFKNRCREIFCAPHLVPTKGVCKMPLLMAQGGSGVIHSDWDNCTLTRLDSSEFEFTNNSELYIFSQKKSYTNESFRINGTDVFICLDETQECWGNCDDTGVLFHSGVIESYLSLVGLVISIVCLTTTLIVYGAFPQLLNTPGKILVSLVIALILAQLSFVVAAEAEDVFKLCFAVGVLIHYFFLAAFCWMNVIAFDLWMTFSNRFVTSDSKGTKRFLLYSLYAWLVPVALVLVPVILDFVNFDEEYTHFKPRYGDRLCWISSKDALLLFFAGPLAIFKLFDCVSFIFTATHIAKAKRQGRMATQKRKTCSFIINIKLSLIMGLTWVFAFVANFTNVTAIWYLFIIFNSLQGLFIAICFLCTKKIRRLMGDKYKHVTTKYSPATQTSSLT